MSPVIMHAGILTLPQPGIPTCRKSAACWGNPSIPETRYPCPGTQGSQGTLPSRRALGYGAGMKFSQADPSDGYLVEAYAPGRIQIDGRIFSVGLILSPRQLVPEWGPARAEDLTATHLEALLALDPQVILLGTGARQVFPPAALLASVFKRGIGLEVMDTGAACRTYNILMGEGRQVVAGLLPI